MRFAIEQKGKIEAINAEMPEATQACYRVGINLGDVVAEGEDLLDDSANIETRARSAGASGWYRD